MFFCFVLFLVWDFCFVFFFLFHFFSYVQCHFLFRTNLLLSRALRTKQCLTHHSQHLTVPRCPVISEECMSKWRHKCYIRVEVEAFSWDDNLHFSRSHIILTTPLWSKNCYPHIADEKTGWKDKEVTLGHTSNRWWNQIATRSVWLQNCSSSTKTPLRDISQVKMWPELSCPGSRWGSLGVTILNMPLNLGGMTTVGH